MWNRLCLLNLYSLIERKEYKILIAWQEKKYILKCEIDTKCDLYLCVYGNILSLSYGTQHHYESNLLQLEIN